MDLAGIRLRGVCKIWHYDCTGVPLSRGDLAVVSTERGVSLGVVTDLLPSYEFPEGVSREYPRVLRTATAEDVDLDRENQAREKAARETCVRRIAARGLPMKLIRAELLLDRSKAIFYFTADGRIDFRELVKDLARELHTRIEMRQIGVRDEARVVGGMGPCGKELCCATFLTDFAPITVKMAKDQRLSLNPAKLSGVCGRLMCCLIYEHHSYARVKGAAEGEAPCASCSTCPPPREPDAPPAEAYAEEAGAEGDVGAVSMPDPGTEGEVAPTPRKEESRPVPHRRAGPAPSRRQDPEPLPEEDDAAPGDEGGEDEPDGEDVTVPGGAPGEAPRRRRRSRRRRGRGGKGGGPQGGAPPGNAG